MLHHLQMLEDQGYERLVEPKSYQHIAAKWLAGAEQTLRTEQHAARARGYGANDPAAHSNPANGDLTNADIVDVLAAVRGWYTSPDRGDTASLLYQLEQLWDAPVPDNGSAPHAQPTTMSLHTWGLCRHRLLQRSRVLELLGRAAEDKDSDLTELGSHKITF